MIQRSNELEVARLKGHVSYMKEQQDAFSREILDSVRETNESVKNLNVDMKDVMSALRDDKYTSRTGVITQTVENGKAIREIQEGLRLQKRLWITFGTIVGGVASAIWGFLTWWNKQ